MNFIFHKRYLALLSNLFILITSHRDNLYNTNDNFDYGGFRELIEAQSQTTTSATLFAYRFRDPGVYVFYLSSDVNKRFVSNLRFLSHCMQMLIFL